MVLSYAGGPGISDLEGNIFGLARGPVEARVGLFFLKKADALGVMVQRVRSRGDGQRVAFASSVFVPWSSILMVEPLQKLNDDTETKGNET